MCLSVPAEIIEINGEMAIVSVGGSHVKIGLQLIENPEVGDFVLVHTGFALEKIDKDEAHEMLKLLNELNNNPGLTDSVS